MRPSDRMVCGHAFEFDADVRAAPGCCSALGGAVGQLGGVAVPSVVLSPFSSTEPSSSSADATRRGSRYEIMAHGPAD